MKYLSTFIVAVCLAISFVANVYAINPLDEACVSNPAAAVCSDNSATKGKDQISGPEGVINTVFTWLVRIIGLTSVIMIIIGGFRYITSSGDSVGLKNAKNTIIYALVGLMVTVFAGIILRFVVNRI